MSYEEAGYKVVHESDNFEIRYYEERIVIQARSKSGNSSFRKLFNYISGQNKDEKKN